jgi:hypothetical protein
VWRRSGKAIPRSSYGQYSGLKKISRSQARPGDLVFFFGLGAHHVGLYIGGGRMVHAANPARDVLISNIDGPWYTSAQRFPPRRLFDPRAAVRPPGGAHGRFACVSSTRCGSCGAPGVPAVAKVTSRSVTSGVWAGERRVTVVAFVRHSPGHAGARTDPPSHRDAVSRGPRSVTGANPRVGAFTGPVRGRATPSSARARQLTR